MASYHVGLELMTMSFLVKHEFHIRPRILILCKRARKTKFEFIEDQN